MLLTKTLSNGDAERERDMEGDTNMEGDGVGEGECAEGETEGVNDAGCEDGEEEGEVEIEGDPDRDMEGKVDADGLLADAAK
jgi:hypothetical protein